MKSFDKYFISEYVDVPYLDAEIFVGVSKNPDKYPVVIGFMSTNKNGNVKGKVAYAICSNSDPFNEETGKNIVVGKLIFEEDWDFEATLLDGSGNQEISLIESFIDEKVEDIITYFTMREMRDDSLKNAENIMGKIFSKNIKDLGIEI